MLSFTFRRVLSRPGIFSVAKRLPTRSISSNKSFAITVQRNFTTTASDRNSDSSADSKPEPESKPKSTRRKTGSSPKTAGKKKKVVKKKVVKKKAVKKPKVTISSKDKPPKGPGGPYIVWIRHWISTEPKFENLEAAQKAIKRGSQIWKALPEYEKQQYREKARVLLDEHRRRMEEWRENVDPAVLRELNRRRVAKGHNRIRGPPIRGPPRPANGYIRFSQRLQDEHPLERTEDNYGSYFKAVAARAKNQWRAMSDAERAEYKDLARADFAAWREARSQAKA